MDNRVMHRLSYGLFVVSAKSEGKTNGCIINTVMQVTSQPLRIVTALNKSNFTHDLMLASGEFNISILDETVPFEIFKSFGFRCGRECDKFAGVECGMAPNGVPYLSRYANSYMSCRVVEVTDLGSHSLFLADVVGAKVLGDVESVTYAYYHKYIKGGGTAAGAASAAGAGSVTGAAVAKQVWRCKVCGYDHEGELAGDFICPVCKQGGHVFVPKDRPDAKLAWRCKICNYIYEEEVLPADYLCPLCKHPVSDFERIIV